MESFLHNPRYLFILLHDLIVLEAQLLNIDALLTHYLDSMILPSPKFCGESILQEIEHLPRERNHV